MCPELPLHDLPATLGAMNKWLFLLLPISAPLLAHTGPHVVVPAVTGIVVDGDSADWPKDVEWHALESADAHSLTARFAVGADRTRGLLNVVVDVTDDVIAPEGQPADEQDGVEIFVDVPHRAARDLPAQYFLRNEFGVGNPRFAGTARGVSRIGEHRSTYEFQVDLRKLAGARGLPPGDFVIGFDVIALDRDGPGRYSRASWTPGDDKPVTNAELGDAWFTSAPSMPVIVSGRTAWAGVERAEPPRRVYARRRGAPAFFVSAPTGRQGVFTLELPPGEYQFRAADSLGSPSLNTAVTRRLEAHAPAVALDVPLRARPLAGKLDDLIPKLLADYDVRAAQVAVIENGRIATSRAWGVDRADQRATKATVFRVASITKVVTTMTVLNLVEQGKWDLDQPLTRYWTDPDLADDPRRDRITTRLVLQQRTGLPNWRDGKLKLDFDPGERNQYSGEGFEWLRRSLEKATGESLEALATRLVFQPAGMKSTTYLWPAWVPPRYSGEYTGDTFVGYVNEPEANGAADLMSTAEDLARFGIWVMNGGGLSQNLWREVEDTSTNASDAAAGEKLRGLGWVVTRDGAQRDTLAIHHGGGQSGIATELFLVPGQKRGLVVLTNGSAGRPLLLAALNATLNAHGGFPRLQVFTEDRARD
jgi:CubicO group peptidase (beta-lactamase class C family)